MSVVGLARRFGSRGTVSRETFDLATGDGTTLSATEVPMGTNLFFGGLDRKVDTMINGRVELRIAEVELRSRGFPVPLVEGDLVQVEGLRLSIKVVSEREFRGDKVFFCQAEGA